jgi:hypothetical protein
MAFRSLFPPRPPSQCQLREEGWLANKFSRSGHFPDARTDGFTDDHASPLRGLATCSDARYRGGDREAIPRISHNAPTRTAGSMATAGVSPGTAGPRPERTWDKLAP